MRARANAHCRVPGPPRTAAAGALHQRPRGTPASAQLAINCAGQRASSRPRCDSVAVMLPKLGARRPICTWWANHPADAHRPRDPFCRPRYSTPASGKFKRALPSRAKCRCHKKYHPPSGKSPCNQPCYSESTQAPPAKSFWHPTCWAARWQPKQATGQRAKPSKPRCSPLPPPPRLLVGLGVESSVRPISTPSMPTPPDPHCALPALPALPALRALPT